jgi:hypothetical protein
MQSLMGNRIALSVPGVTSRYVARGLLREFPLAPVLSLHYLDVTLPTGSATARHSNKNTPISQWNIRIVTINYI